MPAPKYTTTKLCLVCGSEYRPRREHQKYCSKHCAATGLHQFSDERTQTCRTCRSEFTTREWVQKHCSIECTKLYNALTTRAKMYGLSQCQLTMLRIRQNDQCALCPEKCAGSGTGLLQIEHGHESGKVRGLLCINCNLMLGGARDRIWLLERAIEYLSIER